MKTLDILNRANRSILRSKVRTILTIMAIMIGAITLSLSIALGQGIKEIIDAELSTISAENVIIVRKGDFFAFNSDPNAVPKYNDEPTDGVFGIPLISKDDITFMEQLEGVQKVIPYFSPQSEYIYSNGEKYTLQLSLGSDAIKVETISGTFLGDDDKNKIVLPLKYVATLGYSDEKSAIGQKVKVGFKNLLGEIFEEEFEITGIISNSFIDGGSGYISASDTKSIYNKQNAGSETADLPLAALIIMNPEIKDFTNIKLALRDKKFTAETLEDQIASIKGVITGIQIGVGVFASMTIIASVFGIVNTMLMSVYERTKEIGLMKALGMHSRTVFGLFAIEAASIGFWGGFLGIISGFGIGQILNFLISKANLFGLEDSTFLVFTPVNSFIIVAVLVAVSLIAGALPAIKASRVNPIEALRFE